MYLKITSSTGNFNYCNPQEISTQCYISLLDDENKPIKRCRIETEQEWVTDDFDVYEIVDWAINEINEYYERVWSTSKKEDLEFAKYLEEKREKITNGNKKQRIDVLTKRRNKIEEELNKLK